VPDKPVGIVHRFFHAVWLGFKALATPIAALSAVFASLTALGVYEGEQNRQIFERRAHAYTVIHDYSNFVIASQATMRPCIAFLQTLNNEDLSDILFYSRTEHFQYDAQRHKPLEACVNDGSQDQAWSVAKTRLVRFNVIKGLHAFDDALLSFKYDVGDKHIICQNLIGYLDIWFEYYKKLIELKFIDDRAYPNIKTFVEMFEHKEPCPPPAQEHSTGKAIFEGYASVLNWLLKPRSSNEPR
jgi:hypothetical protein